MSIYALHLLSARRRALLTRAGLAKARGLTSETIARLERGRFLPSPSQAFQLALALGIDPVEFGRWTIAELLSTRNSCGSMSLRVAECTHLLIGCGALLL